MTERIDETGTLLRKGGGFVLNRDRGGQYLLQLARTPVDLVGKRVRVIGEVGERGVVDVEGVRGE